ncbi:hypothetical protein Sked_37660 [Sanguibacter keddieii DSM 10542]|uniref:Polymerase nucleotidyl transferase domain-containing protein n=2 Tax=Sanguibacter keddieii TaxID=60920 RepID=D1BGD2_SANKS|nr:hypothetical protein Sked_37660 [Sanguibacter keddieii DSM 10542]
MRTQHPLATVTPTLDGDVLVALASAPQVTFTTGQVERLMRLGGTSKGSLTGIRKVLNRLVAEGTVDRETVAGVGAYRFNDEHLAAPAILALVNLRSSLVGRLEETTRSWGAPPVFGALFGSAARGQMTGDSDIDIFLVRPGEVDDQVWGDQVASLSGQVRRWTGNRAEVLELDEAEVVEHPDDLVLGEVVRDGLVFAGPPTWLVRLQRPGRRRGTP